MKEIHRVRVHSFISGKGTLEFSEESRDARAHGRARIEEMMRRNDIDALELREHVVFEAESGVRVARRRSLRWRRSGRGWVAVSDRGARRSPRRATVHLTGAHRRRREALTAPIAGAAGWLMVLVDTRVGRVFEARLHDVGRWPDFHVPEGREHEKRWTRYMGMRGQPELRTAAGDHDWKHETLRRHLLPIVHAIEAHVARHEEARLIVGGALRARTLLLELLPGACRNRVAAVTATGPHVAEHSAVATFRDIAAQALKAATP